MKPSLRCTLLAASLSVGAYAGGQTPIPVHTFLCSGPQGQGVCPSGGTPTSITQASDGNFYGTAESTTQENVGGNSGGAVFSLSPAGDFTVLHKFGPGKQHNWPDGSNPIFLIEGSDGRLYGETLTGGATNYGALFRLNKDGSGFQLLHSFCIDCADGFVLQGLAVGNDGNIYGTTLYGGTGCANCGTIFEFNVATATYKVVVNFSSTQANPSSLVVGPDGTLYGFTIRSPYLFHYSEATRKLQSTLLSFPANVGPSVPVLPVLGANGHLYGLYENVTTGVGLLELQLNGTIVEAYPALPNFSLLTSPTSPLVRGGDGNFWMALTAPEEILTISSTDGSIVQTLTPFSTRSAVGDYPSYLISANDGQLWGETQIDGNTVGSEYGAGVVYSLNPTSP
jgi:uncharacterized repeat protein (TIGR03803 family)